MRIGSMFAILFGLASYAKADTARQLIYTDNTIPARGIARAALLQDIDLKLNPARVVLSEADLDQALKGHTWARVFIVVQDSSAAPKFAQALKEYAKKNPDRELWMVIWAAPADDPVPPDEYEQVTTAYALHRYGQTGCMLAHAVVNKSESLLSMSSDFKWPELPRTALQTPAPRYNPYMAGLYWGSLCEPKKRPPTCLDCAQCMADHLTQSKTIMEKERAEWIAALNNRRLTPREQNELNRTAVHNQLDRFCLVAFDWCRRTTADIDQPLHATD